MIATNDARSYETPLVDGVRRDPLARPSAFLLRPPRSFSYRASKSGIAIVLLRRDRRRRTSLCPIRDYATLVLQRCAKPVERVALSTPHPPCLSVRDTAVGLRPCAAQHTSPPVETCCWLLADEARHETRRQTNAINLTRSATRQRNTRPRVPPPRTKPQSRPLPSPIVLAARKANFHRPRHANSPIDCRTGRKFRAHAPHRERRNRRTARPDDPDAARAFRRSHKPLLPTQAAHRKPHTNLPGKRPVRQPEKAAVAKKRNLAESRMSRISERPC